MAAPRHFGFKQHLFKEGERLWLAEATASADFSAREAKVRLRDRLPPNFSADRIDPRFYLNGQPTPLGLWHVDPGHPLLEAMDQVLAPA